MKQVQGKIGLWGRIHIECCPYCGRAHHHDDHPEPGDTREAPCGGGVYRIVEHALAEG
jgi:hypothetical protein